MSEAFITDNLTINLLAIFPDLHEQVLQSLRNGSEFNDDLGHVDLPGTGIASIAIKHWSPSKIIHYVTFDDRSTLGDLVYAFNGTPPESLVMKILELPVDHTLAHPIFSGLSWEGNISKEKAWLKIDQDNDVELGRYPCEKLDNLVRLRRIVLKTTKIKTYQKQSLAT